MGKLPKRQLSEEVSHSEVSSITPLKVRAQKLGEPQLQSRSNVAYLSDTGSDRDGERGSKLALGEEEPVRCRSRGPETS